MKILGVIIAIVCGFFAYVNFSNFDRRSNYIESCLYIMQTDTQKAGCYEVYPENDRLVSTVWGVASSVGVLVGVGMYIAGIVKQEQYYDEELSD